MASEARSTVARVDRDDPLLTQLRQDGTARLRFSRPLIDVLDELSIRLNLPVEDVMNRAVTLLKVASDAQTRGETVCLVDDDSEIVGEILDLGGSRSSGIRSFPNTEPDDDDQ